MVVSRMPAARHCTPYRGCRVELQGHAMRIGEHLSGGSEREGSQGEHQLQVDF